MFSDWLVVLTLACIITATLGAIAVWWLEARQDRATARQLEQDFAVWVKTGEWPEPDDGLFDWATELARDDWSRKA